MSKSRLDPDYLAEWRSHYRAIVLAFTHGDIPLLEAIDCMRHLGFKGEALKIEILELHKAKREARGPVLEAIQ